MSEIAEQGDPDEIAQRQMMNLFLGTAQAYGGKWCEIFGGIADGRAAWKIHYPIEAMLFSGVLLFMCQLGARRGAVKVILPSGKARPLRHLVLHSPSGFAWGYGGSGPADLALSILCDVLGERPSEKKIYHGRFKAYPHHQDFKREFVARWEYGGGFEIDLEPSPAGCASGAWRCSHDR